METGTVTKRLVYKKGLIFITYLGKEVECISIEQIETGKEPIIIMIIPCKGNAANILAGAILDLLN